MRKPLIGITVDCERDPQDARTRGKLELNWNYAEAIADAGGVPIIIPPMADMREVSKLIDGWLIPGGNDIDASNFGQENHPAAELQDPARFEGEKALYQNISPEMPVLGICYGCQFLNVVRGGDLIQHLPDIQTAVKHTGGEMQEHRVDAASRLASATEATSIHGKSYHHQAVQTAGTGLKVVATNEDGTVEAVEATDRPWMIGVQWHPERTPEDAATQNLFKRFVESAAEYAELKHSVTA